MWADLDDPERDEVWARSLTVPWYSGPNDPSEERALKREAGRRAARCLWDAIQANLARIPLRYTHDRTHD